MALTPSNIQASLIAVRAGGTHALNGVNFDNLAIGLGSGIAQWAVGQPQNLALTGIASGTLGTGMIMAPTTKLTIPPNTGVIQSALVGAGVAGPLASSLAIVVSLGLSQAFMAYGQYSGPGGVVGVGADISQITVVNMASLVGILNITLASSVGLGSLTGNVASGLGIGIGNLLLQGTGIGSVIGTPIVPPVTGSGPTFSMVV